MSTLPESSATWEETRLELPDRQAFVFRSRVLHQGIFHEAEMQLVWHRPDGDPLVYLIGSGHADYRSVEFRLRADGNAIWLLASNPPAELRPIASLELTSGEFHAEGDFLFAPAENAWATVQEQEGILIEKQLTWLQDSDSGVQRLLDGERGLIWERTTGAAWRPSAGSPDEACFPRPDAPYRMKPPGWATAT